MPAPAKSISVCAMHNRSVPVRSLLVQNENCSALVVNPSYPTIGLAVFVLWGVLGNGLVCIAILTERKLQNVTNIFLLSLAIADLLVSLIVMPWGIASELNNGYWLYGFGSCSLYTSLDVFLCSASIVHMSVIAFDRYRGISEPFKARNKTRLEVGLKIGVIWTITIVISCPITILSIQDSRNIYEHCLCGLFPNFRIPYYQLYGSMLSFVLPSIIMVVTYIKTVLLLRRQLRMCTVESTESYGQLRRTTKKSLTVTPIPLPEDDKQSLVRKKASVSFREVSFCEPSPEVDTGSPKREPQLSGVFAMQQIHAIMLEQMDSNKRKRRTFRRKSGLRDQMKKAATMHFFKSRRDSVQIVARERKATQVLGVVFFAFFFCWTPFFVTNIILAICGKACANFPPILGSIFLWLGYISSTINPVIYTFFNKTFRTVFLNVLKCKCFSKVARKRSSNVSIPYQLAHYRQ